MVNKSKSNEKDYKEFFNKSILENKSLWGIDDLMEFTGLKRQTIYNLCSKDKLPYRKRFGRLYFVPDEILNLYLE